MFEDLNTKEFTNLLFAITHDLKTPLISIQGFASLLLEEGKQIKPPEQEVYLKRILANVDSMENMIRNFLDLRKIQSLILEEGLGEQIKMADVEIVMREILQEIQHKTSNYKVLIEIQFDDRDAIIEFDSQWLKRVLRLLLENAFQYVNPDHGKIWLRSRRQNDQVLLRFENNGVEVSSEEREKVFELLYRGMNQGEQSTGSGLGLTLAQSILAHHRSKIWLEGLSESSPQNSESGTAVCILIPLVP